MVIHVVCFKFRNPADMDKGISMLKALEGNIDGLISMDVGRDFLHSGRSYDIGLVAKLQDREALGRYANDPKHVRVKEYIKTVMTNSVSVDFEV